MSENEINLSIIIVNFRSQRFLSACLASIRGKIAAQKNIEIIVVNNDADENIESNKEDFPEVVVVNNEKNAGYGQACNLGARQAQGEILLFLNPDTEILSGDISKVLDLFKNEKVAVIGSGLRMEDGKKQKWSAGREINLGNLIKNNLGLSGDNKINASIDPQEVAWVAGTAVFVRKDIFQKMGGFDEKIFMYFEDVDLCRRIKDSGYKIIYYSLFQVLHHGGKSYLRKSEQKKHYYASQEYYFKKHFGRFQAKLVSWLRKVFSERV